MMSTIALQSYGIRGCHNSPRISSSWTMLSSNSAPAVGKEKEFTGELQRLSIPETDNNLNTPSNIKFERLLRTDQAAFQGDRAKFRQFVAREAQLDEEYWMAAWLRAESHWEDQEHDRFAENYKRKFAEQEYYAMKTRYNAHMGEKCKCIVMVKKEDKNVKPTILKSIVGTLDLSIRFLSHGETFPGEPIKFPLFCLINRKASIRYGYVANLCVAKSARRQGIARSMLEFAVISAIAHGAEKVFVHVHRSNIPAQALYQKMGFQVVDAASSQLSSDQNYLLCLEASNYSGYSFSS